MALTTMSIPDELRRVSPPVSDDSLGDLRFRALLSDEEWCSLPPPVRRRFSKRLAGGRTAVYAGEVLATRMNRAGWCLAQLARLIGGPLPLSCDANMPSVVTVTEDMATGGQIWTRLYARRRRLSADHPFLQALCRSDRHRGVSRPRLRHGARHQRAQRHAGVSQRSLFSADFRPAVAPAALALAGRDDGDARRAQRRPLRVHAGSQASALRRDDPPVGGVSGVHAMTSQLFGALVLVQMALGAFD